MIRIFFFLAGLFGAVWERSGPSADPNGKPAGQGQGLLRGDGGIG